MYLSSPLPVKVNSRLKRVNMAWNGLGMEGAAATSACLKNNSILTELDISSNRITQEAAAIIGKGLEANETLKIFRVSDLPRKRACPVRPSVCQISIRDCYNS